jgi:Domain of unknown function (DUF4234)
MSDLTKSGVGRDILLTILTVGLWNFYVQFRQIQDTNALLGREEMPSFTKTMILSIITIGIYFGWFEYKMAKELHLITYGQRRPGLEYAIGIFSWMGLWFVVDLYQQDLINRIIEKRV